MHHRAFTFLELLVAVAILAACLLPVLAFAQRGILEAEDVRDALLARQVLIDLCERFRGADPTVLEPIARDASLLASDRLLLPVPEPRSGDGPVVRRGLAVVRDFQGVAGLHRVDFRVSWVGRDGRSHEVGLSRLVHWHLD